MQAVDGLEGRCENSLCGWRIMSVDLPQCLFMCTSTQDNRITTQRHASYCRPSTHGMASAANESHATSSAVADDENWKYIECAKCREGAVIQDKQDPNIHALRPDFHLTACGHIACLKCLQGLSGFTYSPSRRPLHTHRTDEMVKKDFGF